MKRTTYIGILSGALLLCVPSTPAAAVGTEVQTAHVMIAEISPESASSASEEYVELYNSAEADATVTGWQLQYRSASQPSTEKGSWSTKAILGCKSVKAADCVSLEPTVIQAGETFRLSSYDAEASVQPLVSGMSTAGGQLRLLQPKTAAQAEVVQDMVGYGAAQTYEGKAAAVAPKAGQSALRLQDVDGRYVDTDDNAADFGLRADEEEAAAAVPESDVAPGQSADQTYLDLEITELLPDPASPQLDSTDEFVELYNPNDVAVDLTGYTLRAGATWSYKYTFAEGSIEPYEYIVVSSAQSHLSLSNSGSGVRLYDPSGELTFEVPTYDKAKSGYGWARDDKGAWVWTTHTTPGEENIISLPVSPPASTAKSSTAKTTTKKTAAAKTTSTKKAATSKSTTGAVKGAATVAPVQGEGHTINTSGYWIMAVAGVIAGGYALFEYRQEVGGFVRRRWEALGSFGKK